MVSSGQILLLFATSCTVYSHPKDVHPYFQLTLQLASQNRHFARRLFLMKLHRTPLHSSRQAQMNCTKGIHNLINISAKVMSSSELHGVVRVRRSDTSIYFASD